MKNSYKEYLLYIFRLLISILLIHNSIFGFSYAHEDDIPQPIYELYIEIDYMKGHKPTESVLEYIKKYYLNEGISIKIYVDQEVPLDDSVNYDEFWEYEKKYNNLGDDKAKSIVYGIIPIKKHHSKWKWVLYGTLDGMNGRNGYTYHNYDSDGGNYIYISDELNDNLVKRWKWMLLDVSPTEVETVVLMHELGHSIGIIKNDKFNNEIYDPNPRSVMHEMTPKVCNSNPIHYSEKYWDLRDMEYYLIK